MELGDVIELITGIMSATKPKEGGGFEIDRGKLAMLGATFAGQQVMSRWQKRNTKKVLQKAEQLGIDPKDLGKLKKKKGHLGRNLSIGAVIGVVGYLLVMKPEERTELFKNIDGVINEVTGLINEFQGKLSDQNFA